MRHTRTAHAFLALFAAALALFLLSGCASTGPEPTELRDARLAPRFRQALLVLLQRFLRLRAHTAPESKCGNERRDQAY